MKTDEITSQETDIDTNTSRNSGYLIKWLILSVIAGLTGSCVVQIFISLLSMMQNRIAVLGYPAPLWAIAGAVVVGGIIYKIQPDASVEGMPSSIRGIKNERLYLSTTFFKFWAALVTIGTFGSGGIVGPLGRVSAGLVSFAGKKCSRISNFNHEDQRSAAICGLAAAIGAIFQSPIGGGIFAVEVLHRTRLEYKNIFPGILASTTSVLISKLFGWPGFFSVDVADNFMNITAVGWLLILAVLTGISGGIFTRFYEKFSALIKRRKGNVLLKVMIGSLVAASIGWVINPELLGASENMAQALFINEKQIVLTGRFTEFHSFGLILIIMAAVKIVITCIAVGSGMSAGFAGPSALSGMLLGAAASYFLGIEIGSPTYFAFVAAGFSGMIASVINVPLAAAVITTELFGLHYSLPAGVAAVIGFQINRTHTIYDIALKNKSLFTGILENGKTKLSNIKDRIGA
ncbi:Chloride channel protein [Chitinispirillum alkaliphilum]|nr:Chloride channel protein [Chitinispirillum alkaliphilum]